MSAKTLADLDLAISQDAALEANLEASLEAALQEIKELRAGTNPDYSSRVDKIESRVARMHALVQEVKADDVRTAPTAAAVAGGAVRTTATPANAVPSPATNSGTGATGGPSPTKPAIEPEPTITSPHGAVVKPEYSADETENAEAAAADPENPTPTGTTEMVASANAQNPTPDTLQPLDPDGELATEDGEPAPLGAGNHSTAS